MLATPNGDKTNPRPKFSADDIRDFYIKDGPQIFPPGTPDGLVGPKYDGVYLRTRLEQELGSTRLNQTWTNVAIPTFDIKQISPVIFSSYKVLICSYFYSDVMKVQTYIFLKNAYQIFPIN